MKVTNREICEPRLSLLVTTSRMQHEASTFQEIVSRGSIARPPLRPTEVYVTRRIPLVVYFKRCMKLLRGPYAKVRIRGAGSCIETAIYLAQDVVAAFGGKLMYAFAAQEQHKAPPSATEAAAAPPAPPEGHIQRAAMNFAEAASKLASIEQADSSCLLSISAETTTAHAHEEVLSLDGGNGRPTDAMLEAAGIRFELNVSTCSWR